MSTIAQEQPGTRSAGLKDDRIAVAKRRCNLPGRDGDREVPGRDDADDTDRFAGDFNANVRAGGRQNLTGQTQRFAGKEIEDLSGADRLADAFGERLAFFARQKTAQLFLAGQDFIRRLAQDGVALEDAGARPGRKRSLGCSNCRLHIIGGCLRIGADNVIGIGRMMLFDPCEPTHSPAIRFW